MELHQTQYFVLAEGGACDGDLGGHCMMDGDGVNPEETGQERRGVRQGGS